MMKNGDPHDPRDSIAQTAQKWNTIAEGWHAWIPRMREWYAPATDLMLNLAHIERGSRVTLIPYENGPHIAEHVSDAKLSTYTDVGHLVP